MRSTMAPSSGPSMCAVKKRPMRLMLGCIVVVLDCVGRFFAGQPIVEYLSCNRGRRARAEARVLDDHRDCDFRLVGGRVGNEEGVIAKTFGDSALHVFLAFQSDDLGSPRFARVGVRS